ncbi:MAG: HNH endonuclease [Acidiferrobacteraceae bacterium]
MRRLDRFQRFELSNIDKSNDCWIWQEAKSYSGYAELYVEGRRFRAARVSYELYKGPIDPELEISHICHNRLCVNPSHLAQATHWENCSASRKLSPADEQRVLDLYQSGLSQAEIAVLLSCSQSNISYIVRDTNSKGGVRGLKD